MLLKNKSKSDEIALPKSLRKIIKSAMYYDDDYGDCICHQILLWLNAPYMFKDGRVDGYCLASDSLEKVIEERVVKIGRIEYFRKFILPRIKKNHDYKRVKRLNEKRAVYARKAGAYACLEAVVGVCNRDCKKCSLNMKCQTLAYRRENCLHEWKENYSDEIEMDEEEDDY